MLTIKTKAPDGWEILCEARDIRADVQGGNTKAVGWVSVADGRAHLVDYPATVYVMGDSGATVAKYVVTGCGEGRKAIGITGER